MALPFSQQEQNKCIQSLKQAMHGYNHLQNISKKTKSSLAQQTSDQILIAIYEIIDSKGIAKKVEGQNKKNSFDDTCEQIQWKCKCRKTKCLKLYCQCFAVGQYCKNCNCLDCNNLIEFDQLRALAIDEALVRDPNAFDSSFKQRKGGCICKKTGCIKKYCQCYNTGNKCTFDCRCHDCKNKKQNEKTLVKEQQKNQLKQKSKQRDLVQQRDQPFKLNKMEWISFNDL